MSQSSARPRFASTASPIASGNSRLRVTVTERVGRLRVAMSNAAPLGLQKRVADLMGWRQQRATREVTGVEKLSVELLLAEVIQHREEGREAEADALLAIVNEDQPVRVSPGSRCRDSAP